MKFCSAAVTTATALSFIGNVIFVEGFGKPMFIPKEKTILSPGINLNEQFDYPNDNNKLEIHHHHHHHSTHNNKKEEKGVAIEMPNFDELYYRISQVSPLASMALHEETPGDFAIADPLSSCSNNYKWKKIESNKNKLVHSIEKIDNFQNLGCPLLRFRSSFDASLHDLNLNDLNLNNKKNNGHKFTDVLMKLEHRKQWDLTIEQMYEIYPIHDLKAANELIGSQYGECALLGVGYVQTKKNFVVSSREQLMVCGRQEFSNSNGSVLIWGTEMGDNQNHLLPDGERHTRARSHLFSTTLMPTGPKSFDVEYIVQLDSGGNIPVFLTTPVIIETIKKMFSHAYQVIKKGEQDHTDKMP